MKRKLCLPASFIKACEQSGITPEQALHSFIGINTFYAHLVRLPDTADVLAAAIFNQWLQSRGVAVRVTGDDGQAGISYIGQLLALIRSNTAPAKKVKQYTRLIQDWYAIKFGNHRWTYY